MDNTEKMNRYRRILQETIERHAQMTTEPPQPESFVISDTVHDHYLLMDVGWEANKRAHYIVVHLRLIDGKVIIEDDGIEYGIARDLIDAGIPAEDIMIALDSPQPRPLTGLVAA